MATLKNTTKEASDFENTYRLLVDEIIAMASSMVNGYKAAQASSMSLSSAPIIPGVPKKLRKSYFYFLLNNKIIFANPYLLVHILYRYSTSGYRNNWRRY